jgi:hypothetical protein
MYRISKIVNVSSVFQDLHQTCDRNLYSEDDQDLEQQLRYKRMLASRALRSYSSTSQPLDDDISNHSANETPNPRSRKRDLSKPALVRMNTAPAQDSQRSRAMPPMRSLSVDVDPVFEMGDLAADTGNGNVNEGCVFTSIPEEPETETTFNMRL